jgi:hypothetical protein
MDNQSDSGRAAKGSLGIPMRNEPVRDPKAAPGQERPQPAPWPGTIVDGPYDVIDSELVPRGRSPPLMRANLAQP